LFVVSNLLGANNALIWRIQKVQKLKSYHGQNFVRFFWTTLYNTFYVQCTVYTKRMNIRKFAVSTEQLLR